MPSGSGIHSVLVSDNKSAIISSLVASQRYEHVWWRASDTTIALLLGETLASVLSLLLPLPLPGPLPPVLAPSWPAVLADVVVEPVVLDVEALPGPSLVVGAAEADAVAVLVDVAVVLSWSGGLCWCMVAPLA